MLINDQQEVVNSIRFVCLTKGVKLIARFCRIFKSLLLKMLVTTSMILSSLCIKNPAKRRDILRSSIYALPKR